MTLVCVVFSANGFWMSQKPTPPVNGIKTPVIIGNVKFLCYWGSIVKYSSFILRIKNKDTKLFSFIRRVALN